MKLFTFLVLIFGIYENVGCRKVTDMTPAKADSPTLDTTDKEDADPTLINGRPAKPGEFPEVVYISIGGSRCSATIIADRAILTAAHCGSTGQTATFQVGQSQYSAILERAPGYPGRDHDLNLGLVNRTITEIKPVSIGGSYEVGKIITLAGYGCVNPGGGGGNDGILRVGETKIIGAQSYDMVSKMPGGAALCFGDSGGPAFEIINGKHYVLGVNSKGNIRDTNYNTRTDLDASTAFFKSWETKTGVKLCGVSATCSIEPSPEPTSSPQPSPEPIECKLEFMQLGSCLKYL